MCCSLCLFGGHGYGLMFVMCLLAVYMAFLSCSTFQSQFSDVDTMTGIVYYRCGFHA